MSQRRPTLRYRPIRTERLFNPSRLYSTVNWASFPAVLVEFNKQLRAWYIAPAKVLMKKSGHYSFAALSITCTLVDTLSQYHSGKTQGTRGDFIRFCRKHIPSAKKRFKTPIPIVKGKKVEYLNDPAEVLYYGVRCGVIHEAHTKLYAAISGSDDRSVCKYHENGLAEYSRNGRDFKSCPTVVFDPGLLLDSVTRFLRSYLLALNDPNPVNDRLRERFKRKFFASFGVQL